jgi:hypothetical protein
MKHDKNTNRQTELQIIFSFLTEHVATGSEVCEHTGIKQKNFTRHKKNLENKGLLKELYKTNCRITGFKAWHLTTNALLFPANSQAKLF